MDKVHLLAGPNNSGKSNVLSVAFKALPAIREGKSFDAEDLDAPLGAPAEERQLRVGLLLKLTDEELLEAANLSEPRSIKAIRSLFAGPTFAEPDCDAVWIEFGANRDQHPAWDLTKGQIEDFGSQLTELGRTRLLRELSRRLTEQWNQEAPQNAPRVLNALVKKLDVVGRIPAVTRIGAFRRITASQTGDVIEGDHDGAGLIERLARLQNPSITEPENRERFARITAFVRALFDDDEAELDVPHDRETLLVRYDGQWLPLENYGTGLHEVVVLAAAATVLSETLVCIEEPEIHLHPSLQRKLLRYLVKETDNQYLIATHSAHLLDSENGSISAVRLDEGNTVVEAALEPKQIATLSNELGARASDLVQANSVIWVEGPSDRTYIRGWLEAVTPDLVEGVHYSLLFYGGRLLSHLSAEDPAVEEFISLPRINRHFTVVIDSDRGKAGARITATKQRVKKEIETASDHPVWITRGYTIENYVPPALLAEAVAEVHPGAQCRWKGNQYQNPLAKKLVRGRTAPVDKPAIAERVMERWEEVSEFPLDLSEQLKKVSALILRAND